MLSQNTVGHLLLQRSPSPSTPRDTPPLSFWVPDMGRASYRLKWVNSYVNFSSAFSFNFRFQFWSFPLERKLNQTKSQGTVGNGLFFSLLFCRNTWIKLKKTRSAMWRSWRPTSNLSSTKPSSRGSTTSESRASLVFLNNTFAVRGRGEGYEVFTTGCYYLCPFTPKLSKLWKAKFFMLCDVILSSGEAWTLID